MKTAMILMLLIFGKFLFAQQYVNPPGLDKFAGTWQYTNRSDTVTLKCMVRYFNAGPSLYIKGAFFYYSFKQGNAVIRINLYNTTSDDKADFGGTKPYGISLDTLEVAGRDELKRKIEEGYIIHNGAYELKFTRVPGLTGGGLNVYSNGQEPLPGYTLPSVMVFIKVVPPEVPSD